jgi:hypothetical protein
MQAHGKASLLFEIRQAMVDRGADVAWLSQYPHEREILFAPLTGIEVQNCRVEGSTIVVQVRLMPSYYGRCASCLPIMAGAPLDPHAFLTPTCLPDVHACPSSYGRCASRST